MPPVVVIACAEEASVGAMYAWVVATSTVTARAALLFWSPSPVFDLPSPVVPPPDCCADEPLTFALSAGVPVQPVMPVKCVPSIDL